MEGFAISQNGAWRRVDSDEDLNDGEVFSSYQPDEVSAGFKTQFTSLEFLDRFSDQEQLAVVAATMTSAPVKLWYDRLLAASFIDLADPCTEAGIDALIAAGLIDADRKQALLAAEQL